MAKNQEMIIPEMCEGCTLNLGEGNRCPVQREPGWLWMECGGCWSKRTDPATDKEMMRDIKNYKFMMWGYASNTGD